MIILTRPRVTLNMLVSSGVISLGTPCVMRDFCASSYSTRQRLYA